MRKVLSLCFSLVCLAFFAQAQVSTFPYTEDFESFSTCSGSCGSACTLINGWTNDTNEQADWTTDVGGTSSSATGPSVDHNPGTSSGKYLYVESSFPCYNGGYFANLVSPVFDFTSVATPVVEFWYHMYGQSMGTMHFDVYANGVWTDDVIPSWTDNQDLWQQQAVILSAYGNMDSVQFRVRGVVGSNFYSDMAVDDFRVFGLVALDAAVTSIDNPVAPFCAGTSPSVDVTISNFGTNSLDSATVKWTVNGMAQPDFNFVATTPIPTNGNSGSVTIGTYTFANNDVLAVWTEMPNGMADENVANDSSSADLAPGLAGTYTIGGTSPDYTDFTSALSALNAAGACGSVVFDVRDGTYNEQLTITEYPGAAAGGSVTFQSEMGVKENVVLTFDNSSSSTNYTVNMDGADNITFHNMTIEATGSSYSRVFDFNNEAHGNTISNSIVRGDTTPTTTSTNTAVIYSASGGSNDNNNSFINNIIEGGSYGMYWYGTGTNSLESGTMVQGNQFLNNYYHGSRLYYQDGPYFDSNDFESNTSYTGTVYRYYFTYCDNDLVITNNTAKGYKYGYGIYLSNCDATSSNPGMIANNMIHVGDTASTSTSYGIYLTNSGFQTIAHNNVWMESDGNSSRAFYGTSGGANQVHNNNFVNSGPGYAAYLASQYTVVSMDNNNLYAPNGKVGFFNSDLTTLADWQSGSGLGANSVSADPGFVSPDDLHTCSADLDGAGDPLYSNGTDIDGEARNSETPDIGADEFLSPDNFTLGADSTDLCVGGAIYLTVDAPGSSIMWSDGSTNDTLMVTAGGTYYVDITSGCGLATDTVEVVQLAPVAVDLGADFNLCDGAMAMLDGGMGVDYNWSTGETTPTIMIGGGGAYGLMITDMNGCTGTDTVNVTAVPNPMIDFGTDVAEACDSYYIDAGNAGASFDWSTGDSVQAITVTTSGYYEVTVTDANGCSSDGELIVVIDYGPVIDLGNDTTLVGGSTLNLDAGAPGLTYAWSTGETTQQINTDSSGTYSVTVTGLNGCSSTDSLVVEIWATGIEDDLGVHNFRLYPNPTRDMVNLGFELTSAKEVSLSLLDVSGRVISSTNYGNVRGSFEKGIDLSEQPDGIYLVQINVDGLVSYKKVIKN